MIPKIFHRLAFFTALLLVSVDAAAYIGPGAGLSVLGSLWTVIVGVVLALFAILTWPLRLLWRRLRARRAAPAVHDPERDRESA